MRSKHLTAATASLMLCAATVSAQNTTCGAFNLSTGNDLLYVAANGTMIIGRPLAPDSTNIAFAFTIADNGAITTRANGTTLQCGFGDNGVYFECGTASNVRSREGSDDELVSDFNIAADGRLSWRGSDNFYVCSAIDSGWALSDLPAWDVILAGELEDESLQDSVETSCRPIEVTSNGCRSFTFREDAGEGGDGDDDADSDSESPAVDGNTGGSGDESGAAGLQSLWTVNAAVAAIWLLV